MTNENKEMQDVSVNGVVATFDQQAVNLPAYQANDTDYLMSQFEAGNNSAFFSSIVSDGTRETATRIYNSISDTVSLRDNINKELNITDFMAHPVELVDENTGEIITAIRVILIDQDGTAYSAVSEGVRSSITRIVQIVGQAPWSPPVKMTPVEKSTRNAMYRVLTLRMIAENESKKK